MQILGERLFNKKIIKNCIGVRDIKDKKIPFHVDNSDKESRYSVLDMSGFEGVKFPQGTKNPDEKATWWLHFLRLLVARQIVLLNHIYF